MVKCEEVQLQDGQMKGKEVEMRRNFKSRRIFQAIKSWVFKGNLAGVCKKDLMSSCSIYWNTLDSHFKYYISQPPSLKHLFHRSGFAHSYNWFGSTTFFMIVAIGSPRIPLPRPTPNHHSLTSWTRGLSAEEKRIDRRVWFTPPTPIQM